MILRREDLEAFERENLAPYAEHCAASRGRRIAENDDGFRTSFGRDRDRIVHSSAYRRLGNKTQVFITLEGEYYRTRLTHTEEVTQIALTIARALGLNLDLTEAICRAHDLGHAPFGHAGEAVLAECMAADGGFEHNAQALRIVDLLEREYSDFPGLNLSWEVREGIAKHGRHALNGDAGDFLSFPQSCLEAQISDLADSISYGCHDLDDGLAAGLLKWESLDEVSPEWWTRIRNEVTARSDGMAPDLARRFLKRYLVNLLVSDAITVTSMAIETLSPTCADDIRRHDLPLIGFSEEIGLLRESLHQFLTTYLYRHHVVETMWVKAQRLIRSLFDTLLISPDQLPPHIRARAVDEPLERVICDHIAEMTDRAAVREYRRLFEFDLQILP
ncbi:MAG: Deoxyguanosinetriphosphate triphosphohydrolase-like protein [Chloroflexi bacterium]|jgi:dGTPase|nr:Deoxyguanosinetriphosphate triphosphohydrolase-like protein [Chloroflexota bacterium]